MAEHLLSNVYQVGGGNITHPLDGASYLIVDDEKQQHALIDCGSPLGYDKLTQQLNQLNIAIGEIAVVYATHGHYDHIAADTFFPNSRVYMHKNDIGAVEGADLLRTATFLYEDEIFPEITALEPISDGYEVSIDKSRLKAMHTPGHTPGSVCYKVSTEGGAILLAGDTLWGGYADCFGSNLDEWEESLERLANDNFDYVSFGHGITRLVPNAMSHIDKARSRFRRNMQPSHNGRLLNPWQEPESV